ncbi:hypothetical protein [Paenibacillus sp.]|uniref:hypothetical protein n=1 Tax=Paenibacillus sp. TaxID=58172 RepID=UPI002D49B9B2|nr:hypothetical protein [Paenibacillus sp.]HZG58334.1 hypothetical protein [Paenibacillus sp.]
MARFRWLALVVGIVTIWGCLWVAREYRTSAPSALAAASHPNHSFAPGRYAVVPHEEGAIIFSYRSGEGMHALTYEIVERTLFGWRSLVAGGFSQGYAAEGGPPPLAMAEALPALSASASRRALPPSVVGLVLDARVASAALGGDAVPLHVVNGQVRVFFAALPAASSTRLRLRLLDAAGAELETLELSRGDSASDAGTDAEPRT